MKQSNWDSYWDKKINEHFNVKPRDRIDLREFVENVFSEKYGITGEATLAGKNLTKRDNIDKFVDKINNGDPFELSAEWLGKTDIDDSLKGRQVVIQKGKQTKASLEKIANYKKTGDTKQLSKLTFETDMVYADDEWNSTDEVIEIGLGAIEKTAEFGSRGGKEPTGAEWEAIISYVNNGFEPKGGEKSITKFGSESMPYIQQAKDMLASMGKSKPSGDFTLAGQSSAELSKQWNDGFKAVGGEASGATKTSKTDVAAGKIKMSFKKAGGSQLMSGGQGETMATIMAVEKTQKLGGAEAKKMLKSFKNDIKKKFVRMDLDAKETIGSIEKTAKMAKEKGKQMSPREAEVTAQREANQKMTKMVRDLFSQSIPAIINKQAKKIYGSPDFKFFVCREAMTGEIKFGNGEATANHMFVFDPSRRVASLAKISDAEVAHVAKNTDFNVSYKTSGEGGSAWIALKGIYQDKMTEGMEDESLSTSDFLSKMIESEFQIEMESFQYDSLEEGLTDMIKGGWSKLTSFVGEVWEKVKKKVLEAVFALIDKAIQLADDGFAAVAKFFGVQMEAAQMEKNPDVADLFLP